MVDTTLAEAPVGRFVRIHQLQSSPPVCKRLRELGFFENAVIRCMVNNEGSLICQVCNSRVGLTREIARDILVAALV
jgi:Fe2+ transport system protein FeoA